MADFDFKAATPDTSVPVGAFVFGADSQAATDPSIYPLANIIGNITPGSEIIEIRNGTTAQGFYVYNTYTDGSNYERGVFKWNTNVLEVGSEAAGTGTLRNVKLKGANIVLEASYVYGNTFIQAGNAANASNAIPAGVPYAGSTAPGTFRAATIRTAAHSSWYSEYQAYVTMNVTTGNVRDAYAAEFEIETKSTDTKTASVLGVYGEATGRSTSTGRVVGLEYTARLTAASASPTIRGTYVKAFNTGAATSVDLVGSLVEFYNSNLSATYSKAHGIRVIYWDDDTPTGRDYACESLQMYNRESFFVVGSDYYQTTYYYDIDGYGNYSVHNAWTSGGTNRESAVFKWVSNVLEVGTEAAGTGTLRAVKIKGSGITLDADTTVTDAKNVILGSTTGTKIGTATTQKLGFYNKTPVVQPTALTTALTSITHTAPGTPDYAIQDLTNSGGYGFVTKDEGNTVLSVILNLQTRVNELESKLQSLGLLA